MFPAGGHPQHPEAEEALSQTGLGHGFCPDEVRGTLRNVHGFYGAETSSPVCVLYRYQQSSKSSSHPSSLQPGTKSESLREEMEEAANRMEICRVRHQTRPPPLIYVPPAGFTHNGATMTGPRNRSDSFPMIHFLCFRTSSRQTCTVLWPKK